MPFDDTGFVPSPTPEPPPRAAPGERTDFTNAALAVGAWLVAWGLVLTLVGIAANSAGIARAGILAVLGFA